MTADDQWSVDLDTIEATLSQMNEHDRNDAIEALRSRFDEGLYTRLAREPERDADDIAEAIKPIVVVIENPQDDPDTFVIGDVELIELSSYPASRWAAEDHWDDPDYSGDMRELADRVQNMPGQGPALAVRLRGLADEYDRLLADEKG